MQTYTTFVLVYSKIDSTCSKALTYQMSLLDKVWRISQNGINFKVQTTTKHDGGSVGNVDFIFDHWATGYAGKFEITVHESSNMTKPF